MAVTKGADGCYGFECPCGFVSAGWSKKADATARETQHQAEHDTAEPMTELADFTRED